MNYQEALAKLKSYGQEHVLIYYNELTKEQQEALLTQIDETDFSILVSGREAATENKKGVITPLTAMQLPEIEAKKEGYSQNNHDHKGTGRLLHDSSHLS